MRRNPSYDSKRDNVLPSGNSTMDIYAETPLYIIGILPAKDYLFCVARVGILMNELPSDVITRITRRKI